MEFEYLGRRFILVELVDPFKNETFDIIQVMEITYNKELEMDLYTYINYFYGATFYEEEVMIRIAKTYIDVKELNKDGIRFWV